MTLLEHLEDEQKWLRDRLSKISQMIVRLKTIDAQPVASSATISSAMNVVGVTYTQRTE